MRDEEGHHSGSKSYRRLQIALFFIGIATFSQLYSPQGLLPLIAADQAVTSDQSALMISAATLGVALGVIQSGTSAPFAAGMVLISFAEASWWAKLLQIFFFAVIAILPSVALIATLSRVGSAGVAAATRKIDRFLGFGRVAGRILTLVVGVALVALAAVRIVQLSGVLS